MKPLLAASIPPGITLAEWANLHAHLLWAYDGPVDPHGHGEVEAYDLTAWMLRKGSVEVRIGRKAWSARAGEWFFPPQGRRVQSFTPDARIVSLRFRARWPTGTDFYQEGLGLKLAAAAHPELLRAAMPLARLVARHFPKAAIDLMQAPAGLALHLRLQTLFSAWFETVVSVFAQHGISPSHMGKIDLRLLQVVHRLDKLPLCAPPAESDLASVANLSVSQLNRLFLRQFGVSSRGYFEQRRHQHALARLESSPETVKEIAYELGFSSLPHFSAWFRRRHGMSPREFRLTPPRQRYAPDRKT